MFTSAFREVRTSRHDGTQFRTVLKPLNTILPWCSSGWGEPFIGPPWWRKPHRGRLCAWSLQLFPGWSSWMTDRWMHVAQCTLHRVSTFKLVIFNLNNYYCNEPIETKLVQIPSTETLHFFYTSQEVSAEPSTNYFHSSLYLTKLSINYLLNLLHISYVHVLICINIWRLNA